MKDMFVKIGWKIDGVRIGWESASEALDYEPLQSHSLGYVIHATPDVIVLGATDHHMPGAAHGKQYESIVRIPVSEITDIALLNPAPPIDLKSFLEAWHEAQEGDHD